MNDLDKIKSLLAERLEHRAEVMERRKQRLLNLINQHGYDKVSLATGWGIGTITQYCSAKTPIIGLEKLVQAEEILNQL